MPGVVLDPEAPVVLAETSCGGAALRGSSLSFRALDLRSRGSPPLLALPSTPPSLLTPPFLAPGVALPAGGPLAFRVLPSPPSVDMARILKWVATPRTASFSALMSFPTLENADLAVWKQYIPFDIMILFETTPCGLFDVTEEGSNGIPPEYMSAHVTTGTSDITMKQCQARTFLQPWSGLLWWFRIRGPQNHLQKKFNSTEWCHKWGVDFARRSTVV